MKSLKTLVSEKDALIQSFTQLVNDYPDAQVYKDDLSRLKAERAALVSQIGKGKS